MIYTNSPSSWRERDEKWQSRAFYLSSFVRIKLEIDVKVYQFIDHLINQGYKPPLDDLNDVDREIKNLYQEYIQNNNYTDRT